MLTAFLAGAVAAALLRHIATRMIATAEDAHNGERRCPYCSGQIWTRTNPDGTRGCQTCGRTGTFAGYTANRHRRPPY